MFKILTYSVNDLSLLLLFQVQFLNCSTDMHLYQTPVKKCFFFFYLFSISFGIILKQVKHFEPIWGENKNVTNPVISLPEKEIVSPKVASQKGTAKRPSSPVLRNRTIGAVTRSVSLYREKRESEDFNCDTSKKFKSSKYFQFFHQASVINFIRFQNMNRIID